MSPIIDYNVGMICCRKGSIVAELETTFNDNNNMSDDKMSATLQQDMCTIWTNLSHATDSGLLESYNQLLGGAVDCGLLYVKGSNN